MPTADRRWPMVRRALLCAALLAAIIQPTLANAWLTAPAAAQPDFLQKASFELVTDRSAHEPGSTAQIAAFVHVDDGWHVNSHIPSDEYLIPTELSVALPAGWPEATYSYPTGKTQTFTFAELPLSVYDGQFRILATVEIPADVPTGPLELEVGLRYQACDDTSCLAPVETAKAITLMIGPGGVPTHTAAFDTPAGEEPAAPAVVKSAQSLWSILLLALLGGLILNAMPCVLPVLSLKVFALVRSAGEGRRSVVTGALATSAGILASFWALAIAAIAAKAAGSAVGWGIQFQNPLFVTALTVVILLFCLNLWGLFEIPLPQALARVGSSGPREGLAGHFGSGLFATLMATPCSAPFLGVAIGFALAQPPVIILAVFTAVGLGMASPYLALAAFPKAAGWLPKPGAWMDLLKGVMGFLLAAAAVWLLYVLAAQVSPERLAFVEAALLLVALFVWLRHRATRPAVKRWALGATVVAVALSLWLPAGAQPPVPGATESTGRIQWVQFDRGQAEALARDGEIVFVDVTADWCFTCKVNERLILNTETVATAFEEHNVIAMKADWTNRDAEIGEFLASFGRYGIPFYALYRPGGEPQVFSELPSKRGIAEAVDAAAAGARGAGGSAAP
jgi:suppressor for copper-sensitivity B